MLKYTPNWSGEAFLIKRVKNTVLWAYFITDLNVEEDFETLQEKNCKKKASQNEFRHEKVTKRKDDTIYVKWKGYDNSFNSWTDKKYIA